jgi:hypothetical protein
LARFKELVNVALARDLGYRSRFAVSSTGHRLTSGSRLRWIAVAIASLVAVSLLGYGAYDEYGKRELRARVAVLVGDTTLRLSDALVIGIGGASIERPDAAAKLDDQARAVDANLEALRRAYSRPNRPLVDAAELYTLTARELLRRMASTHRSGVDLTASTKELFALSQGAARRSESWIGETLRAKHAAERDFLNYRGAAEATASLLASLSDSRAKLALEIDPNLLLDDGVRAKARDQALEMLRQAADEIDRARRLPPPR